MAPQKRSTTAVWEAGTLIFVALSDARAVAIISPNGNTNYSPMRNLAKNLAFALLDRRRSRGMHLMMDLRYWLRTSPKEGVVLDVGANEGHYAAEFRRYLQRRVYAFEPVRSTFEKLEAHSGRDRGIVPFQLAMGSAPGTAEIAVNPQTSLVSSLRPNAKWHSDGIRETVQVSTVDSFCNEHGLGRVAVLKIDVEGYEGEVLSGARGVLGRGIVDFLVLETAFLQSPDHHRVTIDMLVSHLTPLGYEPWGVYDCELAQGDRGGINFMNVVFGRRRQE